MKFEWLFRLFVMLSVTAAAMSVSILVEAGECEYNRDDHYNYDFRYGKPCVNCCQNDCCGFLCAPAPAGDWAYNPPAYLKCSCEGSCDTPSIDGYGTFLDSFYYRSDSLWWRACEEGLSLGTEEFVNKFNLHSSLPRILVFNRAREKRPNFRYNGGIRIGIGNHCLCSCWDFALNWTHFRTKANVRGFTSNNVRFFPCWERVKNAIPDIAKGHYLLKLDLVDLEFGYKYYASDCFILRPQFGLRLARIHQSYRAEFEANRTPTIILSSYISQTRSKSHFLAVGPRLGIDMELDIGCGLAFFGGAAGSILFGKFRNHASEFLTDYNTISSQEISDFIFEGRSSKQRTSRLVTDLAIGLKWNRCFEWCNRCHPVSLALAWEHHGFFAMNAFNFANNGFEFRGGIDTQPPSSLGRPVRRCHSKRGDLFTQGLTLAGIVGF